MQVGSLVICPNGHYSYIPEFVLPASEDIIYEVIDIKEVFKNRFGIQVREKGVFFDAIINTILWYEIEAFREVQTPMEIKIEDLIHELC